MVFLVPLILNTKIASSVIPLFFFFDQTLFLFCFQKKKEAQSGIHACKHEPLNSWNI